MQPVRAAAGWDLPTIESIEELAAWFGLTVSELSWFADLKGLGYRQKSEKLHHYHYRILPKPSGEIRLIEAPKSRLRELQRKVLSRILSRIPPHPAAHGFIKGRSIKTFVLPHVGQHVMWRMDLRHFFPVGFRRDDQPGKRKTAPHHIRSDSLGIAGTIRRSAHIPV
ncbi:MAG: hypothetical protein DMG97_09830 [Acidobacteria bacterium]|nr:MAG: hypothetical protein DMG97_09830 [Acidobacteriota bacterium]